MTKLSLIALALGLAGSVATAHAETPRPHKICIRSADISSLSYPDDRTILFRMNGGTVKTWRNELTSACFGLQSEGGIAWDVSGGIICENMQVFYVLRRDNHCLLGSFVPADRPRQDGYVPPPPKH